MTVLTSSYWSLQGAAEEEVDSSVVCRRHLYEKAYLANRMHLP